MRAPYKKPFVWESWEIKDWILGNDQTLSNLQNGIHNKKSIVDSRIIKKTNNTYWLSWDSWYLMLQIPICKIVHLFVEFGKLP